MTRRERVVVGMSGGVDSSVTAWLLKQQGYDVVGLFMKNWEDDDTDEYCTSREDLVDAAAVADVIGIDLEAVNFAAEYRERVFAHFLRDYEAGRTPNPDVLCNSEIKFRAFLDHALTLGANWIATGHYARLRRPTGATELRKAADAAKDQTYFLHRLTQAQLAPVLFPLGDMTKRDVRAIARREAIPTYGKRDSTGICFIGERPFRDFLARYLPRVPGPIVTPAGATVGRHDGLAYYTIGQRQGLGVGGTRDGEHAPWFVAAKDAKRNALIAVQGHDHPLLYRREVHADDVHWIAGCAPALPARLAAKTRYRMPDAACDVRLNERGGITALFDAPQWAPTPGQYLVLYDADICLGGGVIDAVPEADGDASDVVAAEASR
jgi:tRNA-uridine 2-sulfurtransferase